MINAIAKIATFIINLVITFFLTSYIIKYVGKEAYGFVGLANDFINYAQVFAVALNSMASRFIAIEIENKNVVSANKYYSSLFFMNIGLSVVTSIVGCAVIINLQCLVDVGGVSLIDVKLLWAFLLANFIITLVNTAYEVAPFCKNRLDLEAGRTVVSLVIKAGILVVAYAVLRPQVWYIGFATVIATVYVLFFNIRYTRILLPQLNIRLAYFDFSKIAILIKSGFWNSLTKLGTILSSGLDLIVTNLYVGSGAMGILSVSKTIPKAILNFFAVLASAFAPRLVLSYAHNDLDGMRAQLSSSVRLLSLVSGVPMILLLSCGQELYSLWVPSLDARLLYVVTVVSCISYVVILPLEAVWNLFTAMNRLKVTSTYLLIESASIIIAELTILNFLHDDDWKLIVIAGINSVFVIIRALVFLPPYTQKCIKLNCKTLYGIMVKNVVCIICIVWLAEMVKRRIIIDSWIRLIVFAGVLSGVALAVEGVVMTRKEERKLVLDLLRGLFGNR